jgi:hypothetical protein
VTDVLAYGERVKLARTLGVDIDELAYVDALDVAQLRALRDAISARLFDDAKPALSRVAAGSKLLPTGLVARVGEKVFGAMLCARIAGLLAPPHALAIALHMPDAFLAQVSAMIDPRTAGEVVAAIPAPRIVAVARVLVGARDFVTMARFVDYLSPATIKDVIDSIPAELDLLHIAAYVESRDKLAELVGQLEEPRVHAMLRALRDADATDMRNALAVAEMLDDTWRYRLNEAVGRLGA